MLLFESPGYGQDKGGGTTADSLYLGFQENAKQNRKEGCSKEHYSEALYLPVPDRLEVCGPPTALSLTLSVPVSVPVSVGVKVTLIVHLDLAARLAVQVVAETAKSPVVEIEMPV